MKCGICNKIFGKQYDYQIHMRTHVNARMEQCKFCEKRFCDPATLRKHVKYIHAHAHAHAKNGLMEKPFVCHTCHKCFRYKHTLKAHLESQHKEREVLSCPVEGCPVSFSYKSNRNAHL